MSRIAVILLVLLCLTSVSMAEECFETVNELTDLNLGYDIHSIDRSNISDDEATQIAIDMRKAIEAKIREDVDRSIASNVESSPTRAAISVTLGSSTSFATADTGDNGVSYWGVAFPLRGSDYSTSVKRARETAVTGPVGVGGCGAWAYIGQTFAVGGSGSQSANIRMTGTMHGLTQAFVGGAASTNIDFVIKDLTTGTSYTQNIYSGSCSGAEMKYLNNRSFNVGKSINLQNGHTYVAYLKIEGTGSAYSIGEAGSDFGPWDGDDAGECVKYTRIYIDF